MFDRTDYPSSETFVREAIQNSLDARLNPSEPVRIHFTFHEDVCDRQRKSFLTSVISFREKVGLEIPDEWSDERIKWLVVQDFNSKGLSGDLSKRRSDFWYYWLNFGLSNKDGRGRGGRGIGRVTFLITSRIQSVIGYTRRNEDGQSAVCGMSVLRALPDNNGFRSTHAYLARKERDSIFHLHDGESFHEQTLNAFRFEEYDGEFTSGLALAIPYPDNDLVPSRILAAAIENFAPAIVSDNLILRVDGNELNTSSITKIAEDVSQDFNDEAIRTDVKRYLHLIDCARKELEPIKIKLPRNGVDVDTLREIDVVKSMREKLNHYQKIVLSIELPLRRHDEQMDVELIAVIAVSPSGNKPLDRLFRDGMSLPKVRSQNPGELDLILLVEDGELATYLNFCEGKAHLDLLENKEVKEKLKKAGFSDGVTVKRLVKKLPKDLRLLLVPDISEPVADVFVKFFSVPKKPGRRSPPGPGPNPDPPVSRIPPFRVDNLPEGLRVRANPEYKEWPVNLTVTFAYANGSRRPSWSKHDFLLQNLSFSHEGCQIKTIKNNRVRALDCNLNCSINITGFDTNRELDTTIRWDRYAQKN